MLKIYKAYNFENHWECRIEINEEFIIQDSSKPDEPYTTEMAMKEMILFWSGGKARLEDNDGDISKTFAQQLGREIFAIQCERNRNTAGVIYEFNNKNKEGWSAMDGSCGIKIIYVESLNIEHEDFEVEEVK